MVIVRPIDPHDYEDLYQIAIESGHGFTSLPVNEALLKARITHSITSFTTEVKQANNESYLFVLEDVESGKIVGTSAIEAAVGLTDAFYHYRLGKVVHSCRELNVYNTISTLSLCNDYTGATELCTLFLSEPFRINNHSKTLAKSRFLFMAEHPERFSETVIAELRGISDDNGRSPFWAWLEENFFSLDFPTADYLTGIGEKRFIAELMPKYPIYVSLLNKAAQAVIGQVHKNTIPALKMLEKEGFVNRGYVDIFDAGPTVEAKINEINSVKHSARRQVVISEKCSGAKHLISNGKIQNFRAKSCDTNGITNTDTIEITKADAQLLQVEEGEFVRVLLNEGEYHV